jgi:CPA2 family monovalent cation:H+ antiporter-2
MGGSSRLQLRHRHAIVAGYGPVGRLVAGRLEKEGVEVTIVDLNAATVGRQAELAKRCVQGDVRDPGTLEAARIASADALILAIPDEDVAVEACGVARRMNPQIYIVARTNFLSRGLIAQQQGADAVIVEEVVTAEAMQKCVTDALAGR